MKVKAIILFLRFLKSENKFYKDAHFHSTKEITEFLEQSNFNSFSYWQILTKPNTNEIKQPKPGFSEGSL